MGLQYDYELRNVPECGTEESDIMYHEFKVDTSMVLCSNPPKYQKQCAFCGLIKTINCSDYKITK